MGDVNLGRVHSAGNLAGSRLLVKVQPLALADVAAMLNDNCRFVLVLLDPLAFGFYEFFGNLVWHPIWQ